MARLQLDLEMIGIRRGDVLSYWDNDKVTCVVVQTYPSKVYFEGEVMSLSEATGRAYNSPPVGGAGYWCLDGELLRERRARFEMYHVQSFEATE